MALTQDVFLTRLKQISQYKRFIISYSGGLDSSVLLHLCSQLKEKLSALDITLEAIYIDHQLQTESGQWADVCQNTCQRYQIPFQSIKVDAQPKKRQSPEAAARDARYRALKEIVGQNDCLLTAHHLSDQAETFFLQMLRGAGPKGLAAMPMSKNFFHANMARPLLDFTQAEIQSYAEQQQLEWIEDLSNQDTRYKRNFLRHKIMPALKQQWPAMEKTLQRVTHLQAESIEILEEVAAQDLRRCQYHPDIDGSISYFNPNQVLIISYLKQLSPARFNNCIQYWLRTQQAAVLNAVLLQRLQTEFITVDKERHPLIKWHNETQQFALRRHKDQLVLCFEQQFDSAKKYLWDIDKKNQLSTISGNLLLVSEQIVGEQNQSIKPQKIGKRIEVRFRQGGEHFKLPNQGHHSLKKWFQEQSIPSWLRGQLPLFYSNDRLFQVGNNLVDKDFAAQAGEENLYLYWRNEF